MRSIIYSMAFSSGAPTALPTGPKTIAVNPPGPTGIMALAVNPPAMGNALGRKRGAPAPSRTRRWHSTVEDPRMGWVGKWGTQRHVLYLSDAFDIGARGPVHSWSILMFWSMLDFRILTPNKLD